MNPEEFQATLNGPICQMLTPYKSDNVWEVDHEAIRHNLRFLIRNKVKSVALTGSGGECPELTDEERMAIWKTAVEEARDKIVLIVGNGHYSLKGALELTRYGEKIGVDGFVTIEPYYHMFGQEALYDYYKQIAESTSLGVIVYNSPRYSKVNISPALLDRLAQIRNIVGIEETNYDMVQYYDMLRVMEKHRKPVLSGMGEIWQWTGSVVSESATGFFSLTENWWPEGVLAFEDAIERQDIESARNYFKKLTPYMSMMQRISKLRQHSGFAVAKEPMDMVEGVKGGMVRLPLTPLRDPERVELRQILQELGLKLKDSAS